VTVFPEVHPWIVETMVADGAPEEIGQVVPPLIVYAPWTTPDDSPVLLSPAVA
jgi:hypothetical protein